MTDYGPLVDMSMEEIDEPDVEVEYTGAPITPRGNDGLLDGDRIPNMPDPDMEKFVVIPLGVSVGGGVALRPTDKIPPATFHSREDARDVAKAQAHNYNNVDGTPFGVYGPYATDEEVAASPWNHPRSTPCDTYEFVEVTLRTKYDKKGKMIGKEKERVLNHVDFGFVAPSKNFMEDKNVLKIPGSLLTSYLNDEGDLVHPNIVIMGKDGSRGDMTEKDYEDVSKKINSKTKSFLDEYVDLTFRQAVPCLQDLNVKTEMYMEFSISGEDGKSLLDGSMMVASGRLPLAFAKILRTAVSSYYGKCKSIVMDFGEITIHVKLPVLGQSEAEVHVVQVD